MRAAIAALLLIAPLSVARAEPPAISVDLEALEALDRPSGPGWTPPLPGRRPAVPAATPDTTPVARPVRAPVEVVPLAQPTPRPTVSARSAPVPRVQLLTTAPVYWQRPIPVTAPVYVAEQVGARSTAPLPTPSVSDKAVGANVDVEATADGVSALPNGDGFRILFTGDRTSLSDTGERLLDSLIERMATESELRLTVQAYAGGSPETAARARLLSQERAMAVRDYLFDRGVRISRIDVRALGSTYVDGPAERVDLLITN